MLCWAESWDSYTEECYSKDNTAQWVLINPFDKNFTNNLIKLLQDDNEQANAVVGLIFETDSVMTSESRYSKPSIMSEATPADCA